MVKEFCPASCQTHPHAVVSCGVVCTLEEQKPHPLTKGVDTWEGGGRWGRVGGGGGRGDFGTHELWNMWIYSFAQNQNCIKYFTDTHY